MRSKPECLERYGAIPRAQADDVALWATAAPFPYTPSSFQYAPFTSRSAYHPRHKRNITRSTILPLADALKQSRYWTAPFLHLTRACARRREAESRGRPAIAAPELRAGLLTVGRGR